MRSIIVSGNLAADPEILTRKDGTNYTKLRIGNHEYSDGQEGGTKWFTVFYGRTDGIVNALKKGSGVVVIGDYSDGIYTSQRGTDIDRLISANKIDFFSSGKRDDAQAAAQPQGEPQKENKPEEKPAPKRVSAKTAAAPQQADSGVDDLPF